MAMPRKEVEIFQPALMDSYKIAGGYAKKWTSDVTVGNPDLVCALPFPGQHLVEVKHRPEFTPKSPGCANQLTLKQQSECRKHIEGGGMVFAALFISSSKTLGSYMGLFSPIEPKWEFNTVTWFPYVRGAKYDIETAVLEATTQYYSNNKGA